MSFFSWPYPPPPDDAVSSIDIDGAHFRINGQRQHIRAFTDFHGLSYYLHNGGRLSPHALQQQTIHRDFVSYSPKTGDPLGLPGVPALTPRILLMCSWGDVLDPRLEASFLNRLDAHAAAMNAQRFIPLYVFLACTRILGMSLDWQQGFVRDVAAVLKNHVCLCELVNEYEAGDQQVNPYAFDKPDGVVISRGSPGGVGIPVWPGWDWTAIRSRRDEKWLQTIGDSAYAFRHGDWSPTWPGVVVRHPIGDTEPRGAGAVASEKRYTDTWQAFQLGQESAAWFGFGCYHNEAGLDSRELAPDAEVNTAVTFWRGMMSVPEVQQRDWV
jgi:hypothetical protein